MLEISLKRSYLAVSAIKFLVDYLPKIESSQDFAQYIWPKLVEKEDIVWIGKEAKIEFLWLLLEINAAFPDMPSKSYMPIIKRKKLMNEELPEEIAEVLMNGSTNLRITSQGPIFNGIVRL